MTEARLASLAPSASLETTPPSLRRVIDALDTLRPPPKPTPKPPPLRPPEEIPAFVLRPDVPTQASALFACGLSARTERGVVLILALPRGVLATVWLNLGVLARLLTEETSSGDKTVSLPPTPTQRGRPTVVPAEAFPPRPCCGVSFSLPFNEVRFEVAAVVAVEGVEA